MSIVLALFYREQKIIDYYSNVPEHSINFNNNHQINNFYNSFFSLSPNISSLITPESSGKEGLDLSCSSRFSKESLKMPIFLNKKSNYDEDYWIFKQIIKKSIIFSGTKSMYWGLLFWGAVFLNKTNVEGEVWLGNMSMILYEAGQIATAFVLSSKKMEYKKILMLYPLGLLFSIMGFLFLFITEPTHVIYYIVFLIIGGFLAIIYITIGDVICERLIDEADLQVSFKGVKKTAQGIDLLGNFLTGVFVFLMSFLLDWLMICFCILASALMVYWIFTCYKEYTKKERSSNDSSNSYQVN